MDYEVEVDKIEVKAKAESFYSFPDDGDIKRFKSAFPGLYPELFVLYFAHKNDYAYQIRLVLNKITPANRNQRKF